MTDDLDAWRKWWRDSGAAAHWDNVECILCELGRPCEPHATDGTEDDEAKQRLLAGHLRILSTPWGRDYWGRGHCPWCDLFEDCGHLLDCPCLASLIACGLADEETP